MKKICTSKAALLAAALFGIFLLAGCAFTDTGNRINAERDALETLERKRESAETRYLIVLNGLEKYPGDPDLEKERDAVRSRIAALNADIKEKRKTFDQSVGDWERQITEDKLQKQILDREERLNSRRDGDLTP